VLSVVEVFVAEVRTCHELQTPVASLQLLPAT
jgi:hypothetical protein